MNDFAHQLEYHADGTVRVPEDFDGFLLDAIPTSDGLWSLAGIDDDRPVAVWSSYHAVRCVQQLKIARQREKVAEWQLADVTARALPASIVRAQANLRNARMALAAWEAQAQRLEAARRITSWAPQESPFSE